MISCVEQIGPDIAKKYLEHNRCNRPLSKTHKDRLAKAIKDGEWFLTHQGIAFDQNSDLVDGQHRLAAIVDAGVCVPIMVSRGVDGKQYIDSCLRVRSTSDAGRLLGIEYATKQNIAACRMWMHLLGQRSPAQHETLEFLHRKMDAILFADMVASGNHTIKHACIRTMVAIAYDSGHAEDAAAWAQVIKTGVTSESWQSCATRFRDWWMTTPHAMGSVKRVECCQRVYASMLAWVERRGLSKLYAKQVIEWLEVAQ
jgi:hypothetical protein